MWEKWKLCALSRQPSPVIKSWEKAAHKGIPFSGQARVENGNFLNIKDSRPADICNFGSCVFFLRAPAHLCWAWNVCENRIALRNSLTQRLDTPGATGKAQGNLIMWHNNDVGIGRQMGIQGLAPTTSGSTCSGHLLAAHMCPWPLASRFLFVFSIGVPELE